MKDLHRLAAECERELRSLGIVPGRVMEWQVNTRAKKRWGQCVRVAPGQFSISIAAALLADEVDDQAVKNTIMHELLHTVRDAHGHTGVWKALAATVNARLPQYTIQRTTSSADKGVTPPPAKYAVQCVRCGKSYTRERMCALVRTPSRYRCPCGGSLKRIR